MALAVVIVGGGIGGLSLARELGRRGLQPRVLERAEKLGAVGAGIIMNPNAMAVLEGNGLAACVRAQSSPYLVRETFDHRGSRLATRDYRRLYGAGRLAVGALVHRMHLAQCLHDGLPAGTVCFGASARRLSAGPDGVRVETDDGAVVTGDVLVGADGVHSAVRAAFFGPIGPTYLGYRSHRLVVTNRDRIEHFSEFLGRGKRVGLVPIGAGQLYVWTTFNAPSPAAAQAPGLSSGAALRARFADFTDPRVRRALDQPADAEPVLCTDIQEVRQPCWVDGRVVLLGDAAHALTPDMGQGAGMAMEDAAALAEELAEADRGARTLAAALARYEARRRPRVQMIADLSRAVGRDGQRSGRVTCWLRNRRVTREGRSVERVEATLERVLTWRG
jgi:2-heptyl-3-hydroxy-4(1H)-quinolone synthase